MNSKGIHMILTGMSSYEFNRDPYDVKRGETV